MRIAHVVTLNSPDRSYGGPLTVAANQCRALAEKGHETTIVSTFQGFATAPAQISGVRAKCFKAQRWIPRSGFAGTASLPLLWWAWRNCRSYDVMHVHLARDLVTLPLACIALLRGVPIVTQTHGMVDKSPKISAKLLDLILTRPVLRRSGALLYLTERERADLTEVQGRRRNASLQHLRNGISLPPIAKRKPRDHPNALFLARLHNRKRPTTFVYAAQVVAKELPSATFTVSGPDEGELARVIEAIRQSALSTPIELLGAQDHAKAIELLGQAAVYVLPSIDEPYPMTVLEALAMGTPCIVTDSCGLANQIADANCGIVIGESVEDLVHAMLTVLSDSDLRESMSRAARRLARDSLSIDQVVDDLLQIYQNLSSLAMAT